VVSVTEVVEETSLGGEMFVAVWSRAVEREGEVWCGDRWGRRGSSRERRRERSLVGCGGLARAVQVPATRSSFPSTSWPRCSLRCGKRAVCWS
jgi:hypothetical protein